MQIEDLLTVVLDPNLGGGWVEAMGKRPEWVVGQRWRVEYTFGAPGVSLHALALGTEARGIWRYEVIASEPDEAAGYETVTLRITPERRGSAGYHFIAQYRRDTLLLLRAKRYEGDIERPFELRRLPAMEQEVKKLADGRAFERRFSMKAAPTSAIAPPSGEGALVSGQSEEA